MPNNRCKIQTMPWLRIRLAQWQRCCRMQDWKIELRVTRGAKMRDKSTFGETCMWKESRFAEISLLDPADHDGDIHGSHFPYDMEFTLAHEFAHIIVWAWIFDASDKNAYYSWEQAISAIAFGLCAIPPEF